MIGCTVIGYERTCAPVTGGVSRLWVGDANDVVFTEGAVVNGAKTGYSAIALRPGATGQVLFEIVSTEDSISADITQSNPDGASTGWEYLIAAKLAQFSQTMTNFNEKLDSAAQCCQLLFVWESNDSKFFVAGEKYVGNGTIPKFKLRQDGSKIQSGKKFTDFNGQDLSIKGTYSRPAYEFTGGSVVILGLSGSSS